MSSNYEQALALAERGWSVFPVMPRGKQPAIKGWQTAISTPENIRYWFEHHPDRNIGIDCGRSGLTVVDEDAVREVARWLADRGMPPLPSTYTV